jgi:hypothetical protein
MDKKIVGLVGALTTLGGVGVATVTSAQTPTYSEVMQVQSYADLLQPIPNALALLQTSDAARSVKEQAAGDKKAGVELAQYHHHHHHHWRRRYHHHHHHHHWHHHHHHHNYY